MDTRNIEIRMLGNFTILADGDEVLPQLKRAKKTCLFLEYLLLHYGEPVSQSELIDALWPEQERANPSTALRTLLHRFRSLVQKNGLGELAQAIVSTRGYVRWNTRLGCRVDVVEMERLCAQAHKQELSVEARIALLNEALEMYRGPLLANSASELWVRAKSAYYHEMFLEQALFLIELLKQKEDYGRIVQVCRRSLEVDLYDERLHMELMRALVKTGKRREAMTEYQFTTDLHYQQTGAKPSEDIRSLYKLILHADESMEKDIERIQESIEYEDESSSAFVCEYGVFKEIYHLKRRMLERNNSTIFLGLISLIPVCGQPPSPLVLDSAMKQLLEVLRSNLRRGDAISRFSSMQYVLLLPSVTDETGEQVMERIKRKFYDCYMSTSLIVTYKLSPLCADRFHAGDKQCRAGE